MLPALSDDNFSARLFNTYSTTGSVTNNNQQHILHTNINSMSGFNGNDKYAM